MAQARKFSFVNNVVGIQKRSFLNFSRDSFLEHKNATQKEKLNKLRKVL